MGIIFLDWDGVMKVADNEPVRPEAIKNFNYIIEFTGAKVVIASMRRFLGVDYFKKKFKESGIKGEIIDELSILPIETRGQKVADFLNARRYRNASFVIIDDHSRYTESQKVHKLVKVDSRIGLTQANADRAIAILNDWKT